MRKGIRSRRRGSSRGEASTHRASRTRTGSHSLLPETSRPAAKVKKGERQSAASVARERRKQHAPHSAACRPGRPAWSGAAATASPGGRTASRRWHGQRWSRWQSRATTRAPRRERRPCARARRRQKRASKGMRKRGLSRSRPPGTDCKGRKGWSAIVSRWRNQTDWGSPLEPGLVQERQDLDERGATRASVSPRPEARAPGEEHAPS